MSTPVVLHVVRPYRTVEEYLAAEAWTMDARSMVLIGEAELPPDTAVLFDVAIENGDKLVRAEGKVAGKIAAAGNRPAGLRVKLKRYGAATKAFIDRAVEAARNASAGEPVATPASSEPVSMPPRISRVSVPELPPPLPPLPALALPIEAAPAPPIEAAPAPPIEAAREEPRSGEAASLAESSGVHHRPPGSIDAPADRAALLARLRERARSVDLESFAAEAKRNRAG